jgi:hypothetical protein
MLYLLGYSGGNMMAAATERAAVHPDPGPGNPEGSGHIDMVKRCKWIYTSS